jgi:hypothetical protein
VRYASCSDSLRQETFQMNKVAVFLICNLSVSDDVVLTFKQ